MFRIADAKITRYLLSSATAQSAGKARFFNAAGYSMGTWQRLRDDLLAHPFVATFEMERLTEFARKRVYRCNMPAAPNGSHYCVRSVWRLSENGDWWLVTAYPQN